MTNEKAKAKLSIALSKCCDVIDFYSGIEIKEEVDKIAQALMKVMNKL